MVGGNVGSRESRRAGCSIQGCSFPSLASPALLAWPRYCLAALQYRKSVCVAKSLQPFAQDVQDFEQGSHNQNFLLSLCTFLTKSVHRDHAHTDKFDNVKSIVFRMTPCNHHYYYYYRTSSSSGAGMSHVICHFELYHRPQTKGKLQLHTSL